jgi:polyisoprenoid-binding protein YceI
MITVAETSATVIPAGTWSADPAHSTVEFRVPHMGLAVVHGRAPALFATIVGGEQPSIEGTVDATALTTFDDTRDAHLQSPDFFDTARYPVLRFTSTSVEADGDELVVRGDLTMRGTTRPVELRGRFVGAAPDPWGNERIGLELSGVVDRTQWGITWNAPLPGGGLLLPDEIELSAGFSAIKVA